MSPPTRRSGPGVTTPQPAPNAEIPDKESTNGVLSITGCPAGCGLWHECGIGEPIGGPVDYLDSAIFVLRDGTPALSSLREQVAA
jgi:hypothetical protein